MADKQGDGSIAPRRSLGGPILPPPAPEMLEQQRQAEERAEARREEAERKVAERERRRHEKQAGREEKQRAKEAGVQAREQEGARERQRQEQEAAIARQAEREEKRRVAEQQRVAREREEREARERAESERVGAERTDDTLPVMAGAGVAGVAAARERPASSPSSSTSVTPGRGSTSRSRSVRRTRRAQLRLVQVDAWSVMKTSFLLSIALGIVLVVAVGVIWTVLSAAGVWDSVNSIVQQTVGSENGQQFDITNYVGTSRVLGFTMVVAVVDVVLITAISTLGAFVYNLSAALLGGIEVTLAEDR